jgi:hypothetical protein
MSPCREEQGEQDEWRGEGTMSPDLDKRGELWEEQEQGGWAPRRRNRASRGNRPPGRQSKGSIGRRRRRGSGPPGHRRRGSPWSPGHRRRESTGSRRSACSIVHWRRGSIGRRRRRRGREGTGRRTAWSLA